jgi:hypothetical protein
MNVQQGGATIDRLAQTINEESAQCNIKNVQNGPMGGSKEHVGDDGGNGGNGGTGGGGNGGTGGTGGTGDTSSSSSSSSNNTMNPGIDVEQNGVSWAAWQWHRVLANMARVMANTSSFDTNIHQECNNILRLLTQDSKLGSIFVVFLQKSQNDVHDAREWFGPIYTTFKNQFDLFVANNGENVLQWMVQLHQLNATLLSVEKHTVLVHTNLRTGAGSTFVQETERGVQIISKSKCLIQLPTKTECLIPPPTDEVKMTIVLLVREDDAAMKRHSSSSSSQKK